MQKSPQPLFSIITPTFHAHQWIPELLASLAAQSCTDYELLLAPDDGLDYSDFGTNPKVRVLAHGAATGNGLCARNNAFAASRGTYIVALDNDDLLVPNYLEAFRAFFAVTGQPAAIAPTEVFNADGVVAVCGAGQAEMDVLDLAWALASVHVVCHRDVHQAWCEECRFSQDILRDALILAATGPLHVIETRYRLRLHAQQFTALVHDERAVRAEYNRLRSLPLPADVAELFAIREAANRFFDRFRRPGEHWYQFFSRLQPQLGIW